MKIKNLREALALAYALSQPQGMGYMQFKPGPLSEEDLDALEKEAESRGELYLDYLRGRALKIGFKRGADGWECNLLDRWFDHPQFVFEEFKAKCGH